MITGAVRSTKGRLAEDVDEVGERIFRQSVVDLIYPEMRELVRAHQRRGHTVVLSSSALTMQAEPVARYLGIEHVVCNRFVVDEHGVLTGEVQRPVIWGTSKATSVQRFAAEHGIDLRSSYFYADGDEDLALMHLVGNPRPVNPGPGLTKVAERRGWPILRFSSRGGGGPLGRVRNLAAIGSLGPVAAGALSLGVLTRNKRVGVNFLTRFWPETVLTLNGVKLNVTGEENLTAQRPAVFLFNHRNNFDIFIVAALVKDNWTGIAKKELESNPLVGPLGKLMDAAFIDRADTASAVAALAPIEEAARKGLSIVVAPEGTRLDTQSVGPFKKGAFRIAMATGLPIVPIVIRNSDSVARPQLHHAQPGHGGRHGAAAGQHRRLDGPGSAGADRRDPHRVREAARRMARPRDGTVSSADDLAGLLAGQPGTVVLTQASTPTEARLIRERIAAAGGTGTSGFPPVSLGHAGEGLPRSLLDGDEDVRLVPVRVAWLPEEHAGRRAARMADLRPGHDPYHPSERQQQRILARHPGRAVVLAGEPATLGSLRQRWAETTDGDDFASFVARRATLALDRAEYRLRGPRYKTPSLVKDEILSSRRFRSGLAAVRRGADGDEGSPPSLDEAGQILDELAAGWSRRLIDIMPTVGRLIFQRGFDPQIDYDESQVERLRAAMERYPGIFLWSHRSNLDTLVLAAAMQEKGLPPAHLFAGINMAFGPMGALMRRAGVIFIRRSTSDDPLYKYVLREYVGYVLEKRFNLSWSIEGTRSRTGKMLPPRLGLLSYAADVYLSGRVDDILLLPVSITFDQLHEISEYADYARGGPKKPEGFGWLYGFIKAQGARHYGKVYVRFGEPVSLSSFLGPVGGSVAADPAARRLALQKTAFEVAWRINQGMPVTATALVTTVLLAMQGAALTFGQIRLGLADALDYLESRSVPRTASARALSGSGAVRATLDALVAGGVMSFVAEGRDPVWLIGPEQQLAATFYRNSLINFLLDTALCELAVLRARDAGEDPVGAFWDEIARLRDLLKFEFYFKERDEHRRQVAAEMARHDPSWESRLRSGPAAADELLAGMRPLVSHVVVRPFVEAYRLVADVLVHDETVTSDSDVVRRGARARAAVRGPAPAAQRRVGLGAAVPDGVPVARNRGLFEGDDLAARRAAFLAELRDLVRRLDRIEELAIRRYIRDAVGAMPAD